MNTHKLTDHELTNTTRNCHIRFAPNSNLLTSIQKRIDTIQRQQRVEVEIKSFEEYKASGWPRAEGKLRFRTTRHASLTLCRTPLLLHCFHRAAYPAGREIARVCQVFYKASEAEAYSDPVSDRTVGRSAARRTFSEVSLLELRGRWLESGLVGCDCRPQVFHNPRVIGCHIPPFPGIPF